MEAKNSIASLKWSKKHHPLSEVFEKHKLPNLVRVQEGYYGVNDACSFEVDQLLVLHVTRTKQNYVAEDSTGRPVWIPVECTNKLLVCPLSIYCGYDPIYVSEMLYVYPEVKYFRVLENNRAEDIGLKTHFLPKTILEIDRVDVVNSVVKFCDVQELVPFGCRIAFEALMDYREYTLKDAVRAFDLPIKVLFLPSKYDEQSRLDSDYENIVSNLGKTTIFHSSQSEVMVVATKVDDQSLILSETSVKCSQISKNCRLNVFLAKELVKNEPVYTKMVRDFNEEFLQKYDLNELDNLDKCQHLDRADKHSKPEITGSVLFAKKNNAPELLPRNRSCCEIQRQLPARRNLPAESGNAASICHRPLQADESTTRQDTCKNIELETDGNRGCKCEIGGAKSSFHCRIHNHTPLSPKEKSPYHEYEIIDNDNDNDDDGSVEDIYGYDFVHYGANKVSQESVYTTPGDMTPEDYVDMSENYVDMTPQKYVVMTSQQYMKMTSPQKVKERELGEYVNNPELISLSITSHCTDWKTSDHPGNSTGKIASEFGIPKYLQAKKVDSKSGNTSENIIKQTRDEKCLTPKDIYTKKSKPCAKVSSKTEDSRRGNVAPHETTISKDCGEKHLQRILPSHLNAVKLKPINAAESVGCKPDDKNKRKTISPVKKLPIKLPISTPKDPPELKPANRNCTETMVTRNSPTSDENKAEKHPKTDPIIIPKNPPPVPKRKSRKAEIKGVESELNATPNRTDVKKHFLPATPTELPAESSKTSNGAATSNCTSKRSINLSKQAEPKSGEDSVQLEIKSSPNEVPQTETTSLTVSTTSDRSPVPCPESPSSPPIPANLSCLSVSGVGRFLASLNMRCYVNKFREEQIDGKMLAGLDEATLSSLDLKLFHVKKLMKAVEGWRPNISDQDYS